MPTTYKRKAWVQHPKNVPGLFVFSEWTISEVLVGLMGWATCGGRILSDHVGTRSHGHQQTAVGMQLHAGHGHFATGSHDPGIAGKSVAPARPQIVHPDIDGPRPRKNSHQLFLGQAGGPFHQAGQGRQPTHGVQHGGNHAAVQGLVKHVADQIVAPVKDNRRLILRHRRHAHTQQAVKG
ncbi:hypothetical protein DESC_740231 [Desulfosarcina cetonica]|nr:hypothetical protein DESC_740231 [Desulfosarcina cetonica]